MVLPSIEKGVVVDMDKTCFICGYDKPAGKGPVIPSYNLMECPKCGLQFLDPIPDEKRLKMIYDDYYKAWGMAESLDEVSKMKAKTFKGYLDNIMPAVSSGRLLDIGCATGELLEVARNAGFDVYGIEVSAQGLVRCRERFGKDKIVEGNLKAGDFQPGFFDVITLFDVMEHILTPVKFLEIVSDILKPSGMLVMVTPDASSWTRKAMGRRWPHYKEEHIYYYNKDNIVRMLSRHFDILDIRRAKKALSINYIKNVTQAYCNKGLLYRVVNLLAKLTDRIKFADFKISIGEMLILCRKT